MQTVPLRHQAVLNYISEIRSDPVFEELFLTDRDELIALESNPSGWDWADHDGSRVIDGYWLEASELNEQMRLAQVCHLRALAWEAALQHIVRAS